MKFLRLDVIPCVPGGGWVSLGVWVEEGLLSRSSEVTLQESTAANPEYGDFLCAARLAAAGFTWVFFFNWLYCWMPLVGNQFTCPLLTFSPAYSHPHMQDNSHPSVHTLIYKNMMQKCGGKQFWSRSHPSALFWKDKNYMLEILWMLFTQTEVQLCRLDLSISYISTWSTLKEMHLWMVIHRLWLSWQQTPGISTDGGTFSPQQDS